jgi:CheY-like chemotaxis protein
VESLRAEADRLKAEAGEKQDAAAELAEVREKYETAQELLAELESAREKARQGERERDEAVARLEEKTKLLDLAEARSRELEEQAERGGERAGKIELELGELRAEHERLVAEADALRSRADAGGVDAGVIRKEKEEVTANLAEVMSERDAARAERDTAVKERDELAAEVFEKNRLIETLKTRLDSGAPAPAPPGASGSRDAPVSPAASGTPRSKMDTSSIEARFGRKRKLRFDQEGEQEEKPPAPADGKDGAGAPTPEKAGEAGKVGKKGARRITAAEEIEVKATVLLAVADAKLRGIYAKSLEAAGHETAGAPDVAGTLGAIQTGSAQALVIDAAFAGTGADEVLRKLAFQKRRFPVVVLCEYNFPVDQLPALARMKVLTKPVPPDQLATAVEAVIRKK